MATANAHSLRAALERHSAADVASGFTSIRLRRDDARVAKATRTFAEYWASCKAHYDVDVGAAAAFRQMDTMHKDDDLDIPELTRLRKEELELDNDIQDITDAINKFQDVPAGLPIPVLEPRDMHTMIRASSSFNTDGLPTAVRDHILDDYEKDITALCENTKERLEKIPLYATPKNCLFFVRGVQRTTVETPSEAHQGAKLAYEERTRAYDGFKTANGVSKFLSDVSPVWPEWHAVETAYRWTRTAERHATLVEKLLENFTKTKERLERSVQVTIELAKQELTQEMQSLQKRHDAAANTASLLQEVGSYKQLGRVRSMDYLPMSPEAPHQQQQQQKSRLMENPLKKAQQDADIARMKVQQRLKEDFQTSDSKIEVQMMNAKRRVQLPNISERIEYRNNAAKARVDQRSKNALMRQLQEERLRLKHSLEADSVRPNAVRDTERLLYVPEHITNKLEPSGYTAGLLDDKVFVPSFRVAEALKAAGVYSSDYAQERLKMFRSIEQAVRPAPKDSVSKLF